MDDMRENRPAGGERCLVVILCGGKGTRLREETTYKPKPMVSVGGRPILWHVMRNFRVHEDQKNAVLLEVGEEEQSLLRRRVHGHPMTTYEAWTLLKPYLRRQTFAHHRYRVARRLPVPRTTVETLPPDALRPDRSAQALARDVE